MTDIKEFLGENKIYVSNEKSKSPVKKKDKTKEKKAVLKLNKEEREQKG